MLLEVKKMMPTLALVFSSSCFATHILEGNLVLLLLQSGFIGVTTSMYIMNYYEHYDKKSLLIVCLAAAVVSSSGLGIGILQNNMIFCSVCVLLGVFFYQSFLRIHDSESVKNAKRLNFATTFVFILYNCLCMFVRGYMQTIQSIVVRIVVLLLFWGMNILICLLYMRLFEKLTHRKVEARNY